MRILSVSDVVVPQLYDPAVRERYTGVELILGCGDLPYYYLEFLVSMLDAPCCYIAGNHDAPIDSPETGVPVQPPAGCMNLDGQVARQEDLLLGGLEGCLRYNNRPQFQYTDEEMFLKILRMAPRLVLNRLLYGYYLDVLITHAPPYSIHDEPDLPHQGFRAFLRFMDWFRPRYLIHGHIHVYQPTSVTISNYRSTQVVNTYGYRVLDIQPRPRSRKPS